MQNKSDVNDQFILAQQEHQKNKLDVAMNLYEKVLASHPEHFESNFLLGTLLAEKKNYPYSQIILKKAIKIKPNHALAHNNLGITYKELGKDEKALNCFENAILLDKNQLLAVNNLSTLLRISNVKSSRLGEQILLLFKRNDINHKDISRKGLSYLLKNIELNEIAINPESNLLLNNINIKKLLKNNLFNLILQKSLVEDHNLEKILIKIRNEIITSYFSSQKNILIDYYNFIISLGEQCFLNEYVYAQNQKENNLIEKLSEEIIDSKEINELKFSILSCFIPLYSNLKILNKINEYKSKNILFNDLINLQIHEPLIEKKLSKSIASFQNIKDPISKKVSDQYEEFPYPRWRYTYSNVPFPFLSFIKKQIKPNQITFKNKFLNPKVLVAGCGTGNHLLQTANYFNAKIIGIDLSISSLAYANRKIDELELKNIELLHGDIMQLNNFDKKFDIIESVGVLHHLKNPMKGISILTNLLEKDGLLLLGLYSEKARQGIEIIKNYAKKNNFHNTLSDIRKFREKIFNEEKDLDFKNLSNRKDFFSTSSVRDLIFHSHENTYSLKQIFNMLEDLNLEFLGFCGDQIKNKYSKMFPDDKKCILLKNWEIYEKKYPHTFFGMYKFWVKRK